MKNKTSIDHSRALETGLRLLVLAVVSVALASLPAGADVLNGDFENGGADWNFNGPADWTNGYPPAGGNPDGYAFIASPQVGPGGIGCIIQTIICGDPDEGTECTIGFDYLLAAGDAMPNSGRIKVYIDGIESVVVEGETVGWETVTYVVPCGVHVIDLCLEVDPENNAWRACFDNVRAVCTGGVPTDESTWSSLKGLFR